MDLKRGNAITKSPSQFGILMQIFLNSFFESKLINYYWNQKLSLWIY